MTEKAERPGTKKEKNSGHFHEAAGDDPTDGASPVEIAARLDCRFSLERLRILGLFLTRCWQRSAVSVDD